MSKLEELAVGCHVNGLVSDEPVQIIAVSWYGSAVLDITYKTSQGQLGNQLVYREDEARLQVLENRLPWMPAGTPMARSLRNCTPEKCSFQLRRR